MIKLLIGGSPCTYWSITQKNNRETSASGQGWELFKNYLIAKEKFKPDFFLYENNKSAAQAIKEQIKTELNVEVGAKYIEINSALVSAQNRQRFYVHNCGDVQQPSDRGILLKDILESVTGEQGYELSNIKRFPSYGNDDKARPINAHYQNNCGGWIGRVNNPNPNKQQVDLIAEPLPLSMHDKSYCLTTRCGDAILGDTLTRHRHEMAVEPVIVQNAHGFNNGGAKYDKAPTMTANGKYIYNNQVVEPINVCENNKAHAIKAQYHKNGIANFITNGGFPATAVAEPIRIGDIGSSSQAHRVYSCYGKSVTINAGGGGQGGKTGLYFTPYDGAKTTYPIYEVENGLIAINDKRYPIKLPDGFYIIRKLTVKECCRLQTLPDNYCRAVSKTQAYKGLGNGWTAEVIIHILSSALKNVPKDEKIVVLSMYDGIGTGRYCLEKMGFTNIEYYAYEIDKYAKQIALSNYPGIVQCGDAFQIREDNWKIGGIL